MSGEPIPGTLPDAGGAPDRRARARAAWHDQSARRWVDVQRRAIRRELTRMRQPRRIAAMALLILTFGLIAAGLLARGEPTPAPIGPESGSG